MCVRVYTCICACLWQLVNQHLFALRYELTSSTHTYCFSVQTAPHYLTHPLSHLLARHVCLLLGAQKRLVIARNRTLTREICSSEKSAAQPVTAYNRPHYTFVLIRKSLSLCAVKHTCQSCLLLNLNLHT